MVCFFNMLQLKLECEYAIFESRHRSVNHLEKPQ